MITRYVEFLKSRSEPVFENVQQAKDFLKKLEIKRRKSLGIEDKISPEEEKELYNDPYFLKIKNMLSQTPGLVYLFTKTFFEDFRNRWEDSEYQKEVCFEELKSTYEDLKSKKDLWGQLPMNFDKYASLQPDEEDDRPPLERLIDDWEEIKSLQLAKKIFLNRLLPFQKAWFKEASEVNMRRLAAIGKGFANLGMKDDGTIDKEENKKLNDSFFVNQGDTGHVGKYQKVGYLLAAAESHIKNSTKNTYKHLLDKIEKANEQCGKAAGVDVVYDIDGFVVLEVKSYAANKVVNNNITHCIARQDPSGLGYWDRYVDLSKGRRQYYIYDFNISELDNWSVVGITIGPRGEVTNAHLKDNKDVIHQIDNYIKETGIPREVFNPYTEEEQKQILDRIDANKVMRMPNLTFDNLKSAIERGGDINIDKGLPLKNAVDSGDYRSVELLVNTGASVDLRDDLLEKLNKEVSGETNIKIVELLVSNGYEINRSNYSSLLRIKGVSIYKIIKILLAAGMDPNLADGRLLRDGISRKDVEWVEELSKFRLNFAARDYMVFQMLITQGESDDANTGQLEEKLFDIVFKRLKGDPIFKDDDKMNDVLEKIIFRNYWTTNGSDDVKAKRIKFLLDKLIEYGAKSSYDFLIESCKEKLDVNLRIERQKKRLNDLLSKGEIDKDQYDLEVKRVERKTFAPDADEKKYIEAVLKELSKK